MKIRILDDQGAEIALVDNVTHPDTEVAAFGGASWEAWQPSEAEVTESLREQVVISIKREGLRRIGELVPALARLELLDLIVETVQAGMMNAPTAGSDLDKVKNIYQFARGRVGMAQSADRATLENYDVGSDNWPT